MTRVYDKKAIIKQIQTFLVALENEAYNIVPDGIYDERTKKYIADFQKKRDIPISGSVDNLTLDLLYKQYLSDLRDKKIRELTYPITDFPISPGSHSDGLMQIHRAMADLLDYYGYTHNIRESNLYSEQTKIAVRLLREIYMLERNDVIDEELYFRIMNDHKSINKYKHII